MPSAFSGQRSAYSKFRPSSPPNLAGTQDCFPSCLLPLASCLLPLAYSLFPVPCSLWYN
ncbi:MULTISPECIES: hypothetical protein [unclassified Moorena]|uniref:hypothetical protein n=1 Tax=unclassified Moorena TaxID=2683338 RepID=UPI0013FF4BAA|nr:MULTISPECIES: hypothetical protein [unclassified Moorena]NEO17193.1 hypothetical protein [Moorena sp. SIO3E8]NEQ03717.1 hypothetical protein [Moorena sp. SIO3F7]